MLHKTSHHLACHIMGDMGVQLLLLLLLLLWRQYSAAACSEATQHHDGKNDHKQHPSYQPAAPLQSQSCQA
jgi:hypothetical protein